MTKRQAFIRFIKDFLRARTPLEAAQAELIEAQFSKMKCESTLEYYKAILTYNEIRIERLTKRINDLRNKDEQSTANI